jgi:transcriptional regulator with XRE-family HTH domain
MAHKVRHMAQTANEAVAAEIRAEMARQMISGRELARRVQKPETTIARWLRGKTQMSLDDVEMLAKALGVDPVDLIIHAVHRQQLPRPDSNREPAGYLESSAPFGRATGADSAA